MAAPPSKPYEWTQGFQQAVMVRLLVDPILLSRVANHTHAERFADETIRLVVGETISHYKEHGVQPTRTVILQRVREQVAGGKLKESRVDDCATLLAEAEAKSSDSTYVQERILEEAKKAAMWSALDNGLRNVRSPAQYDDISEEVGKAARIGRVDADPGSNLAKTISARTADRRSGKKIPRLGTGIVDLDDVIKGGLAAGELGVVLGAPKFGKSMFLNTVAYHVLTLGGTVLYYSLEMGERDLLDRMDAAISKVPIAQLEKKADFVDGVVQTWLDDTGGEMYVKQFPSYKTTPQVIDDHIEMMRLENEVQPNVIIIDSADFASASVPSRKGRYEDMGQIYSEIRGIGGKWSCPVWTGSWANRESLAKEVVTMADFSDSFLKAGIADLAVALCGTEAERQGGILRLYTAFCRFTKAERSLGPYRNNYEIGLSVKDRLDDDDVAA